MVTFSYVGTLVLLRAFPGRLIIDGTRIEIRRRFRRHSADQSEIEGKYTVTSEYGSFTVLRLYDKRRTISIPKSIEVDDNFCSWREQLPNLDEKRRVANP